MSRNIEWLSHGPIEKTIRMKNSTGIRLDLVVGVTILHPPVVARHVDVAEV